MKRWERWAFNVTALAVTLTGVAYFWMKYLLDNPDPFAVVNHPWEAAMLHLHVLASPLLILVFGIILNSHIIKKLGARRMPNRTSGLASLGLFALMVASGYLLQITTSEAMLQGLVAVHVASGSMFALTYAAHLVISARLGRRRPAASPIREVA